jgi:hypothetical protein
MSDQVMFMVSFLGFWAVMGFIVWVLAASRRKARTTQAMTEFHNRLLDKIGSARDFADFLQSDGGGRFLDSLSLERTNPNQRILGSIQTGAVLLMLGVGLLVCGWTVGGDSGVPLFMGTISLALGTGFLVSAAIAWRLSESWGLLKGRHPGDRAGTGGPIPRKPPDGLEER